MLWAEHHQRDLVFNVPIRFPINLPVFCCALGAIPGDAFGCELADAGDYNGFSPAELFQHGGFPLKTRKSGVEREQSVLDDNVLHRQKIIR